MEDNLRQRAKRNLLRVAFPDGKVICHKNATMTFSRQYIGKVQVGDNRWLTIPPQTKDKLKVLRVISSTMRLGIEVSII